MDINRKNYEAYFLDYWENSLSAEQVAELMIFLEENPDLKSEFNSFESITLQPELDVSFSKKEGLKKTTVISTENIDSDNYDEMLVANMEEDISEDEKKELTAFMELNPKVKLEQNLYRSTILKADTNIIFSDKDSLKKKGLFVLYRTQIIYGLSIAASIIILLGFYFGFMNQSPEQNDVDRLTNLDKVKIIQPEIKVVKPAIAEIPHKYNATEKVPATQTIFETNKNEPEQLAFVTMDSYKINVIDIPGQEQSNRQLIESRHTIYDQFEFASVNDPDIVKNQKTNRSFFKRFIAGMTNKIVDVEKPKNKSFLEYTIDGYNFMTDRDVEVDKELDENGKVVAYKVNGENVSLGRANKNGTTE